jgi:hypothetical protein
MNHSPIPWPGCQRLVVSLVFTHCKLTPVVPPEAAVLTWWKGIRRELPQVGGPLATTGTPSTKTGQGSLVVVDVLPFSPAPLDRLGNDLSQLYRAFEQGKASSAEAVARAAGLQILGDSVSVSVRTNGNLDQLIRDLNAMGMRIATTSSYYGSVEGSIPISRLGDLAALTEASSISPMYRPTFFA